MLYINDSLIIPDTELDYTAIRSQGAGGQNVNKVSTAIQLRFDIKQSSLPATIKTRLLNIRDQRIDSDGVITIKAQEHRSQMRNRDAAKNRLQELIQTASYVRKKRIKTKVPRKYQKKRLDNKTHRGKLKQLRGRLKSYD